MTIHNLSIFKEKAHKKIINAYLKLNLSQECIEYTEKKANIVRAYNKLLIESFSVWMKEHTLSEKTIKKHCFNIEFYINNFLLYYDITGAKRGDIHIPAFLGDFFIRKAMWASKTTINENITSLKKFYTFLTEIGEYEKEDLEELKEMIKEDKHSWFEELDRFLDLDCGPFDE